MKILERKCREWLADYHYGELLFFTGFILYLWRNVWVTTMFPLAGIMTMACIPLSGLFAGLKIILYDRYSVKELLWIGGAAACVLASACCSQSANPFFWILIIIGCKDISFEKILKVYLAVNGAIVFLAFASSLLGVIANLQYSQGSRGVRNSFGIIFPTDFAAHIFYMALVFFYLKGGKLRYWHYLAVLVITGLVFHFCNTRLDCGSLVLMTAVFWMGNSIMGSRKVSHNVKKAWRRLWQQPGSFSMVILAAVSIGMTLLFPSGGSFLKAVNRVVSSRLSLGANGIEKYGFKPFGQAVEFVGFGGTTEYPPDYSFVDCSYVYVLLRYGVIFLIVLLCIFIYSCIRNRHDLHFLYAMALVSVNCTIAHHILQIEYNPFFAALLAASMRGGDEAEGEEKVKYPAP